MIGYSHPRSLAQEFDAKTSPLLFFFFFFSVSWIFLPSGLLLVLEWKQREREECDGVGGIPLWVDEWKVNTDGVKG